MNRHLQGLIDVPMSEEEALHRAEEARPDAQGAPAPDETPPSDQPGDQQPTFWLAKDLLEADLPQPVWLVPDILPAGLTLLAGRPKLGKSWLALQLAVAMGGGGPHGPGRFLGRQVESRTAAYIALEDSLGRMQHRLRRLRLATDCNLYIASYWPPLNGKGLGWLRALVERRGAGLVVVDTLTRAFTGRVDWDAVGQATDALAHLQSLAMEHNCAILLVDHHRKGNGSMADAVDDVMGSTGKSAVADLLWGLYRKRGARGATLHITGRDVEDQELSLAFDPTTCAWQVADALPEIRPGSVQADVVHALGALHGEATVSQLALYLEKDHSQVSREMTELVHKGIVRRKDERRTAPYVLTRGA